MEWRGEGGERVPEGDELGHVNDVGTFRKGLILWEKLNCFFIKLNRLRNHYYFSFFPFPQPPIYSIFLFPRKTRSFIRNCFFFSLNRCWNTIGANSVDFEGEMGGGRKNILGGLS